MKMHPYFYDAIEDTIKSANKHVVFWQPGEKFIPGIDPVEVSNIAAKYNKTAQVILNKDFYFFWAYKTVYHSNSVLGHNKKIHKSFTCLNGKKRQFRSKFVDMLAKHNLIENNYVSLNLWNWSEDDYNFKHRDNKPLYIDNINKKEYWNVPQCWQDSMFSVVTETSIDDANFITEKTWLPIYHKRPFIILGPTDIHRKLRNLGFELFDEYFDYGFDCINDESKIDIIVDQLQDIQDLNYSKACKKIRHKLEHNHNLLIQKVRSGEWLPNLPIADGPHAYLLNTLWTS